METGAFYAAAAACGVKAVWLGHASDRLVKGHWDDWYLNRDEMTCVTAAICEQLVQLLVPGA